jgi:hypothetical protein
MAAHPQRASHAMRWPLIVLVVTVIAIVVISSVHIASNPLRQSNADFRAWLLVKTPLGSTSNEVRSVLEQHGWYTDGFRTTQPRPAADPFLAGELGGYQGFPLYTFVSAFWEFDGSNRLADIRIRRIMNAP